MPGLRAPASGVAAYLLLLLVPLAAPAADAPSGPPKAALQFDVRLTAGEPVAEVRIRARQSGGALRELRLDGRRIQAAEGDGSIRTSAGKVAWQPPKGGGELRYRINLDRQRAGTTADSRDAYVGDTVALFRGEDAFPIVGWRRAKGTDLTGQLAVKVPDRWSVVTPYLPSADGQIRITNPGKRIARPLGWIIAGDLGTRRDVIDGLEVTVSAPRGIRMERIAMLALLRWNLPYLLPATGLPVRYVSIVSAGPPMWLGALSAPNSIFVQAKRPLISENGTSTVLHEMVHVLLADLETPKDQDWIDEGLAEYLALLALRDSGTISPARFAQAIAGFRQWGAGVRSLRTTGSKGPITARAVTVFHDLDQELRGATGGKQNLRTLVRGLVAEGGVVDLKVLRRAAGKAAGRPLRALGPESAPGLG